MKKTTTQGITAREYREGKMRIPQTARYEVWRTEWAGTDDTRFYFHYQSANGEIVSPSQGYTRKAKALEAIELLRYSFDAPVIDLTLKPKARKAKA